MFFDSFQITLRAIIEIVLMGSAGYAVVRRGLLTPEGLKCLSALVVDVFLPLFIFSEIVKKFDFRLYPAWWIFPLLSIFISFIGYGLGQAALLCDKSLAAEKKGFLGVVTFQNAGYLPLPLAASLLLPAAAQEMFIFIFLFLLGFNMTIFSFGVRLLSPQESAKKLDIRGMFNPPVVATLAALGCVFLGLVGRLPQVALRPMETLGRCTIPLSIMVVGGNLASIRCALSPYIRPMVYALVIKLLILPAIFLAGILVVRPPAPAAFLILLEAAMPPAALLSVIAKKQNAEACLVNQATFYGHLISIATVPFFLAVFWALAGK